MSICKTIPLLGPPCPSVSPAAGLQGVQQIWPAAGLQGVQQIWPAAVLQGVQQIYPAAGLQDVQQIWPPDPHSLISCWIDQDSGGHQDSRGGGVECKRGKRRQKDLGIKNQASNISKYLCIVYNRLGTKYIYVPV